MKRNGFLLAGFVFLFFVLFMLTAIAHAEEYAEPRDTTASISAIVIGQGAGYDTGYGVEASVTVPVWMPGQYLDGGGPIEWAIHVSGNIANRKKRNASEGYTYGASGQLRAYYQDAYLGVGYGVAGYRSEFASGAVWKKSMWQPHVQVGYDTALWDLWAAYHFEENDTPNQVSAVSVGGSMKVWRNLKLTADIQRINFLQSGNWMDDYITTIGIGWEF